MATGTTYQAKDYTVGWICALPVELAASTEMLDEEHPTLPSVMNDSNTYTFGRIGEHNIVIGCLPSGQLGVVSAASVAMQMKSRFGSIRLGLMVGIGGGVPSEDCDIRLGDIVVSQPHGQYGGVVQYDFGKAGPAGQRLRTGSLNSPPAVLLTALAKVEAARLRERFNFSEHLSKLGRHLPKFAYPQALQDRLYESSYVHVSGSTCSKCREDELVDRDVRNSTDVEIHYGTIASGNQVMKDGVERDRLSKDLGDILCFEMEAAGLMNNYPCLVIRGICDYADSHKNKKWQPYAAATAAAFAKELLNYVPAMEVEKTRTIDEAMRGLEARVGENTEVSTRVERKMLTAEETRILDWLSSINFSAPQNTAQQSRTVGTGQCLLDLEEYVNWRGPSAGLLWLYGSAGCGKTVLCSTAIRNLQQLHQHNPQTKLAYWYFQFSNMDTQDVSVMLRSLIRQLSSSPLPSTISGLWDRHKTPGSNPSIDELVRTLKAIIQDLEQDSFIVLDALDECPLLKRKELLNRINELVNTADKKLHLLITSRREPDIDAKLRYSANCVIDIEQLVKNDIKRFVQNALTESECLGRWDEALKSQIEERLTRANETRFRWADLQIKRLQDCTTKTQLVDALQTVPESLEATYANILEQVPQKDAGDVRQILIWLTSSFRPMTLLQIATVVSFKFPKDILRVCTSFLVTLIGNDFHQEVKLAHFSVKEYLVLKNQEDEALLQYQFSSQLAHATIAKRAVAYLLDPGNVVYRREEIGTKPLLEYSAIFLPRHFTEVSCATNRSGLLEQINMLFSSNYCENYRNWVQIYTLYSNFDGLYSDFDGLYSDFDGLYSDFDGLYSDFDGWRTTDYPQPLYFASLLGLLGSVQKLAESGAQIVVEKEKYKNAMNAAAVRGHFQTVEWLAKYYGTEVEGMIDLAFIARHLPRNVMETMKVLLGVLKGPIIIEEVVKAAARNRECGEEVMRFLLQEWGGDVVITEELVKTVAGNDGCGKEVMMLLLQERGADVVITEEVVKAAAGNKWGGLQVMNLLKERSTNLVITEEVVEAAVGNEKCGTELMILLLRAQGPDFVITNEMVRAAERNRSGEEVMRLLLRWSEL